MSTSGFLLVDDLKIRKLTDKEFFAFQNRKGFGHNSNVLPTEFIIEGEFDGKKIFSDGPVTSENPLPMIMTRLNNALRCLRTFKEGSVGIGSIDFKFVKFCPLSLGSYGFLDPFVPPGVYKVSDEEIEKLVEHARYIFDLSEPAMETACARLADAEARFRPQDQILDAVIGMEVLLLAGLRSEDRRSELKYRFSLNYSTLFTSSEERLRAYKVAKSLYDLRSKIAHGDDVANKDYAIGDQKLKLRDIGRRAKNELRMLIHHFLPHSKNAPYKKPEFWERAYFGPASK